MPKSIPKMILGALLSSLGLESVFSRFTQAAVETRVDDEAALLAGGLPVLLPAIENGDAGRFGTGVLTAFLRSEGGT